MHRILLEGIQTKFVFRVAGDILSLSLIVKISQVSRFVFMWRYSGEICLRASRESISVCLIAKTFSMSCIVFCLKVFRRKFVFMLRRYIWQTFIQLSSLYNPLGMGVLRPGEQHKQCIFHWHAIMQRIFEANLVFK